MLLLYTFSIHCPIARLRGSCLEKFVIMLENKCNLLLILSSNHFILYMNINGDKLTTVVQKRTKSDRGDK